MKKGNASFSIILSTTMLIISNLICPWKCMQPPTGDLFVYVCMYTYACELYADSLVVILIG